MKTITLRGAWVAQLVKYLTGSDRDLRVHEFEPHVGLCADSSEAGACLGFFVSLSLCPSSTHAFSLSKINIKKIKKKPITLTFASKAMKYLE